MTPSKVIPHGLETCNTKKVKIVKFHTEEKKKYTSTLSLTSALDGGGWLTSSPGRFTPGKGTRYPLYRRLGGPKSQY